MANYLNIGFKITGITFLLIFVFLIIILCVDVNKINIRNSTRRKINHKYKKRNFNSVSMKLIKYGKKIGDNLKIKKIGNNK